MITDRLIELVCAAIIIYIEHKRMKRSWPPKWWTLLIKWKKGESLD